MPNIFFFFFFFFSIIHPIHFRAMISLKVPDMTCQQYDAKDHDQIKDCSKPDLGVCRDCTWPPPPPVIYMIFLFGLNELVKNIFHFLLG